MYKALKTAQTEVNESLLKLVDSITEVSELRGTLLATDSKNQTNQKTPDSDQIQQLIDTVGFLHQKQNAQFNSLVTELKSVNESMATIMRMLITQASSIQTSSTIPSIQPTSQDSDLKNIGIKIEADIEDELNTAIDMETDVEVDEQAEEQADEQADEQAEEDANEAELEEELEAEVEVEAALEAAEEAVAEAELEVEAEVEEEEGVEVEEWTYKGRVFFKDSENTVYANNSGEIGDPIGQYDPVKNIVKPLKK